MNRQQMTQHIEDLYRAEHGVEYGPRTQETYLEFLLIGIKLADEYASALSKRAAAGMFSIDGTIEALARITEMKHLSRRIKKERTYRHAFNYDPYAHLAK